MITTGTADRLFEIWRAERSWRRFGGGGVLRSPSLSLEGAVSSCCSAPISYELRGRLFREACSKCLQLCGRKLRRAPRGASGRGDGRRYMKIKETRVVNRDAQDARLARQVTNYVAVAPFFEKRPRGVKAADWERDLYLWGAVLERGVTRATEVARRLFAPELAQAKRYDVIGRMNAARSEVIRRAQREPWRVRAVLGKNRDRARGQLLAGAL